MHSFTSCSLLACYRDFILRGTVVELAVAVVLGTAFTNLISAVTSVSAKGGRMWLKSLAWVADGAASKRKLSLWQRWCLARRGCAERHAYCMVATGNRSGSLML